MSFALLCALVMIPSSNAATQKNPTNIRLDWLDLSRFEPRGGGETQRRKVQDGHPLKIAGKPYPNGITTFSNSEIVFDLFAAATHFSAMVGIDDEAGEGGSVKCRMLVDGKQAGETINLRRGDPAASLEANLAGAKQMTLVFDDAGDGAGNRRIDIINGVIVVKDPDAPVRPEVARRYEDPDALKVPAIASGDPPEPAIHGPRVVGTTPGRPFRFLIPATGAGELKYSAEKLPDGLSVDPKSGMIAGEVLAHGTFKVRLVVGNELGTARRDLTIIAGQQKLAQTPPMGWNSWNAFGFNVNADKVRAAADAMVKNGLAAKGYQYIGIDDAWQGTRDPDGMIRANEQFGDIKALADYVHSKGLRFGIYSSPGPKTCANFEGSYQHELDDARWYAKSGVDYLKYDWCSYSKIAGSDTSLEAAQRPYQVMRDALDKVDRDIVYSMCQYGSHDVWNWGARVGGNLWRTTTDIQDSWISIVDNGFSQAPISRFSTVGHWNDPDLLVVGRVGWGAALRDSRLTPAEQLTHITLWSMLSAPLMVSCDMTEMDQFTRDLLTNTEVIDIDQDPLGRGAQPTRIDGTIEIWTKPLFDGTTAVAVFNRGRMAKDVGVKWSDIGLAGTLPVRDLWQRKDLGKLDQIKLHVLRHGAVLLKVGTVKQAP
jgi:alpha-galactosidase